MSLKIFLKTFSWAGLTEILAKVSALDCKPFEMFFSFSSSLDFASTFVDSLDGFETFAPLGWFLLDFYFSASIASFNYCSTIFCSEAY